MKIRETLKFFKGLVRDYMEENFVEICICVFCVLFLVLAILCSSADAKNKRDKEIYLEGFHGSVDVVEISVRGERHEYLKYGNSITHLQNCRHCPGKR